MQTYIDTVTKQVYAFEDDVATDCVDDVYTFTTAHGAPLSVPETLQPYTPPEQTQAELVAAAQVIQLSTLSVAYQAALAENVSYTTVAGQVASFQADDLSVARLSRAVLVYLVTQKTPDGFYWLAADNTQVVFSYADLQGLAAAIGVQSQSTFTKYQELKAKINAATTVDEVAAVVWGSD